jgi:D-aminopeptidase
MGLARTGSIAHNGSGDLVIAFSTGYRISEEAGIDTRPALKPLHMNPLFQATVEATEEAIINSMCMARTTVGRDGNTIYAIPLDRLKEVMKEYGRLQAAN